MRSIFIYAIVVLSVLTLFNLRANARGERVATTSGATKKEAANPKTPEAGEVITLDEPDFENGATLMEALQNRKSTRRFENRQVSEQDLSNLLWAAAGVNRDNGGRTVPLLGDIAIYLAMESGVYIYEADDHELRQVLAEDIRGEISSQGPVKEAPVVFILTIDDASFPSYMKDAMEEAHGMDFYYGNQVAYSTQNIYLYACSNSMNAVVIGGFYREKVDQMLGLDPGHHSYLLQLVGYRP